MENVKRTVARNINALRVRHGMTQIDLAEKLNYSDKAVSKWERAESVPDVAVLVQLSELFGVSLDELIRGEVPENDAPAEPSPAHSAKRTQTFGFITGMSLLLVWLLATFVFIVMQLMHAERCWLPFIFAVPATMVVWLVLNSVWFNQRRNYLIISLLMWTVLAAVYIACLPLTPKLWLIFLLGIPGQIIIFFWSAMRRHET